MPTGGSEHDRASTPRIAAIVHDHSGEPDGLLAAFAARQLAAGHRVRGLVHLPHEPAANGGKRMVLMDVTDPASRYPISQALGAAACGCNLDPGGIADASAVLRRALQDRPSWPSPTASARWNRKAAAWPMSCWR
jgi:hypothetical protein